MTEQRLIELEVRYTEQQEFLAQLSDVLLRHERELTELRLELATLRGSVRDDRGPLDPDEKPPHY